MRDDAVVTSTGHEIRANSVLPAARESIELVTDDGLRLVGELALPQDVPPVGTVVFVHPLPIAGGMMDSHLLRKAAWRLPALADLAILRFNTRGTTSAAGTSEGQFEAGEGEGQDLAAAVRYVADRGLPVPWLVGWSFGTDVILRHPEISPVAGAVLLSPPLRFSTPENRQQWRASGRRVQAFIPEHDDYVKPEQARQALADWPEIELVDVPDGKHLWIGEKYVRLALNAIVAAANPAALDSDGQLPTHTDGPMERWSDL